MRSIRKCLNRKVDYCIPMRLHIERTGGFGGPALNADIDTMKLSEVNRQKLYDILRDSKVLESLPQSEPPGNDFFRFKIEATGFAEFYAPGTSEQMQALIELTKSEKAK
jgi:hypothetical protein